MTEQITVTRTKGFGTNSVTASGDKETIDDLLSKASKILTLKGDSILIFNGNQLPLYMSDFETLVKDLIKEGKNISISS